MFAWRRFWPLFFWLALLELLEQEPCWYYLLVSRPRQKLGRYMARPLCIGITKGVSSRTCALIALIITITITITINTTAHCGMAGDIASGSGSGP